MESIKSSFKGASSTVMLVHVGEGSSICALCQRSDEGHELASCSAECCQLNSTVFAYRAMRFRRMINSETSLRMLVRLARAHPDSRVLQVLLDDARDSCAKDVPVVH